MRNRNGGLRRLALGATLLLVCACEPAPDPDTLPDEVLQAELGLTDQDRVYRVSLIGGAPAGASERADPAAISIEQGSYVEFVTTDWMIHEVIFEADSLEGRLWSFLDRMDQTASPPLINRGSRYVLTFEGAPPGRYPYRIEGNGVAGRGTIVVTDPEVH